MNIDGKRIVVTGAASGIGRALLRQLSTYNVQPVAADMDDLRLQESVLDLELPHAQIWPFTGDFSLAQDMDDLFEFAVDRMGGIDLFFANAGIGYCERIERADWPHIEAVYRTNVFSTLYAVAKMGELHQGPGYRVVITASLLGQVALEGYALYSSAKAALDGFAEGYRLEVEDRSCLALVYPLAVRTDFFRAAGDAPLPWPSQSADSVARAIVPGVERDKETIYTSPILPLVLLVDRLFPPARRLYQRINSRGFCCW